MRGKGLIETLRLISVDMRETDAYNTKIGLGIQVEFINAIVNYRSLSSGNCPDKYQAGDVLAFVSRMRLMKEVLTLMRYISSLFVIIVFAGFSSAAYLSGYRGEVSLKKTGTAEWVRLSEEKKIELNEGDEIRTARASTVEVYMEDGSRIKLAPVTAFKMSAENKDVVSLGLYFGRVRSWVKKLSRKFEVRTPSAVCAVRGTDFMVYSDEGGNTRVEVYEGTVLAGDAHGRTILVRQGEFSDIPRGGNVGAPRGHSGSPSNMDSSIGDAVTIARKEIYGEISKEDVISRAQQEIQSAEYQNRKVAIDAFGNRVRMEEYVIRPAADQFKYVVLNTRADRFDFGKILFTFDKALPDDLTLATTNMTSSASQPEWVLTAMNSVMSNTIDKVTEDASGGKMVPDNAANPSVWTHFFPQYAVYAAGPAEAGDNGGLGKNLWSYADLNSDNAIQSGEMSFLGGSAPAGVTLFPAGEDVFNTVIKNTYSDGTWIQAADYVVFDDGKIVSKGDFASRLDETMDTVTDKLNFERVYTSSLFGGRKIDLEFSAKLLKDAGLLRF